jgi:hypothetical protein
MVKIIFDADEDWEKRILCIDEACIGVIGPDGKCKECGKVYEGKLSGGHGVSSAQPEAAQKQKPVSVEEVSSGDDWDKRVLCSDESCIGVIGPDGKCKECGKRGSK